MAITDFPSISIPAQAGNSGKFLKTDGSKLSWVNSSSITLITSGTIASAATGIDITSIPATYSYLMFYLDNFSLATATGNINIRFNNESTGSNYSSHFVKGITPTAAAGAQQGAIGVLDSTGQAGNGIIAKIYDYANATSTTYKYFDFIGSSQDNVMVFGAGTWRVTNTAINQIQVLAPSGATFDSGTYRLYGVR